MDLSLLALLYLIASVTFIVGLKMLSHPETARRGNLIAAVGMGLAIFGTIFLYSDENGSKLKNYVWIFGALIIGTVVGAIAAKRVKMTAMPEMVSLFNGMGGACAALHQRGTARLSRHHAPEVPCHASRADGRAGAPDR